MSITGARSLSVSNGMLGIRLGFTPWVSNTMTQVYPSGAALAAAAVPMEPEAPTRLSSTMGCPRACCMWGWSRREIWSTVPPVGKGTIHLIGWLGQAED